MSSRPAHPVIEVRKLLGAGLALVVALSVVAAALPSAAAPRSRAGFQGGLTFDQAVAAGLVPSLAKQEELSGLPLCPPPTDGSGGYSTPQALQAAIAAAPEAPTCMADPRTATFSTAGPGDVHSGGLGGRATPSSNSTTTQHGLFKNKVAVRPFRRQGSKRVAVGCLDSINGCHFWMGYKDLSSSDYEQGSLINCQARNPTLNISAEFVLCWATAAWLYSGNDVWTQVGWAKGSFDNTTFSSTAVYTEDAYYNQTYPYQHYDAIHWGYSPFNIGQYYGFRARGYWGGGTQYGIIADIFWSGAWQEMTASLNLYGFCSDSGTGKYCSNGQEAEVYSVNCYNLGNSYCPKFNNGTAGIPSQYNEIRTGPGVWQLVTGTNQPNGFKEATTPYRACFTSNYDTWYAVSPDINHC